MCVKYADVFRAAVKWADLTHSTIFSFRVQQHEHWAKTYFRSQAPGWSLRAPGWCLGWFLFRGGQLRSSSSAKSLMFPQSESERRTRVSFGSETAFWILRLVKSSVFVSLLHPRRRSDSRIMIITLRSPRFAPSAPLLQNGVQHFHFHFSRPPWSCSSSLQFLEMTTSANLIPQTWIFNNNPPKSD